MDVQYCENRYCLGTFIDPPPSSSSSSLLDLECPICLNSIEGGGGVALLDCCDHVTCAGCMRGWLRASDGNWSCPYCRAKTHKVISSSVLFSGTDRKELFDLHLGCPMDAPMLRQVTQRMGDGSWRTFLRRTLGSQRRLEGVQYDVRAYQSMNGVYLKYWNESYHVFWSRDESFSRFVFHLREERVDIQLVLTDELEKFREMMTARRRRVGPCPYGDFVGLCNEAWNKSWDCMAELLDREEIYLVDEVGGLGVALRVKLRVCKKKEENNFRFRSKSRPGRSDDVGCQSDEELCSWLATLFMW